MASVEYPKKSFKKPITSVLLDLKGVVGGGGEVLSALIEISVVSHL